MSLLVLTNITFQALGASGFSYMLYISSNNRKQIQLTHFDWFESGIVHYICDLYILTVGGSCIG